jgi:hypothetical protein
MPPKRRFQIALARAIVIFGAVTVAVLLTGRLSTLGAMIVAVLVVLAAEALLFSLRF